MSGFLASVRSAEEALLALMGGADIIDVKEPASGALGRVDGAVLREIADVLGGRCTVSATIGDVPLEPGRVLAAVRETAVAGI
ncbi:MAG TPA: (5-formylfuran-3-yl)methyl phosphate synthase, partial [Stellaceae bacterium]|nr:(5-formylfuran-3-yl)methyl phosphate synthase [Stellaceae bacterium]